MEVKRIPRFYWLQIRNRNAVNLLPEGKLRRKRQPNSGLTNPIVGFTWGMLSLLAALWNRTWSHFALAALVAGLTLTPWTVRNYLVFGRLIPLKSNLAYEMYQSQCLQPDGLLQSTYYAVHPYGAGTPDRREYNVKGEAAYLDRKREQLWRAVRADPLDFLDRVADRFLGATLWYVPFHRSDEVKRPRMIGLSRVAHPLPFLALLVLVVTSGWKPLHPAQWTVIGVYLFYLLPYVVASYYDRYGMPLLGVKVLLVVWAGDRLLSLRPSGALQRAIRGAPRLQLGTQNEELNHRDTEAQRRDK